MNFKRKKENNIKKDRFKHQNTLKFEYLTVFCLPQKQK